MFEWNDLKRRDKLIGHYLRYPGMLVVILEGIVEGRIYISVLYFKNLTGCGVSELLGDEGTCLR